MKLMHYYLCILILLFVTLSLRAQDVRIIQVSGRGYPEDAAYNDAREQALKHSGVRLLSTFSEIRSGDKSESSISRQFYIASIATGMIIEEDTLQPAKLLPGEETGNKPLYEVQLRVKIKQLANEDPYFQLTLKLNPERAIFHDGEQVSIQIESSKECYVTVFSIGSDNQLYLIFPNVTQSNNLLKSHTVCPVNGLTMGLLPGSKEASETIIAIATKENFPFIDFNDKNQWHKVAKKEGQFLTFRIAGAATKLAEWIGKLGEDQWTIARLPYSIIK
jgi:hypothetical protein